VSEPTGSNHGAVPGDAHEAEPKPETGTAASAAAPAPGDGEAAELRNRLGERTADLQRLQAEYSNYRKRVERDRNVAGELAAIKVLSELLPVLDDIGRARDHGELAGGFKSVAESLESIVAKMGLQGFGSKGDPFDPTIHEALLHSYATDVTEPTCVEILQPGYQVGERIIRPARVAVAEPTADADGGPEESAETADN